MSKKKKIIIIIISVLALIGIIAGVLIYIYYQKLDGRECLDCPYVYDLTPSDVVIVRKNIVSAGYNSGYKATVDVGTAHSKIKIDGVVSLDYECTINYCFSASYVNGGCGWNYPVNGRVNYGFHNEALHTETFNIKVAIPPTSIYMHENKIDCNIYISEASGKLKIYGEKIR